MGKAEFSSFGAIWRVFDRFLRFLGPYFALFPSMSCAYLYVHNFRRTRVSHRRAGAVGGRRGNLAFDKETAETARERGIADFGLRISD